MMKVCSCLATAQFGQEKWIICCQRKIQNAKKKLKSIAITCTSNNEDRFKIVLLNQEYLVSDDKNPAITHLAYYVDSYSTLSGSKNSLLFSSYQKYTNYTDCNGLSHFHMACAAGHVKIVKQYLDNGEDIHCRFFSKSNSDRRHKFTPLHFAVAHHNTEVAKLLLDRGADVDATDSSGITPAHLACAVSWDFKKSTRREIMGLPTFRAADLDILQLLIKHDCDLSLKDHNGDTPLLSIFKNDYYGPLRVNEVVTMDIHTIDQLASFLQVKQISKFEMLFDYGADITAKNYNGESILHCVIEDLTSRRFAPSSQSDCDGTYAQIIRILLESSERIDVNAKNKRGETPIALAVSLMSHDIVEILLKHNADPSSLSIDGHHFFRYPNIPLTVNLIINFEKIMSALASKGYKFTLKDKLMIMKFLAHDVDDCDCGLESLDQRLFLYSQLIFFGTSAHMKRVVRKTGESSNSMLKQCLLTTIGLIVEFCKLVSYPLLMDKELRKILNDDAHTGLYQSAIAKYQKDVKLMKSTTLSNGLPVYDIMSKFPSIASIPRYLQYDGEEVEVDGFIESSILNHLKKLRVRKYIGSLASKNYIGLLLPSLPDNFRIMIMDYLDVEDILRLCAATLLE